MNIQMQLCALAIILILLFFFLNHKKVGIYTEQVYLRVLLVSLFSVSFDAFSLVSIYKRDFLPYIFVIGVCKTYLASVIYLGCMAFLYVMTDVCTVKRYRIFERWVYRIAAIESCIIFFLPISIYQEEHEIYTYGTSVSLTYLFAITYILFTFRVLIKYRKRLVVSRRIAVLIWMGLWIIAAAIQFFNSSLLLVSFACALGMMIIFFALENPQSNIDRQYDCFQSQAFRSYMKYCYEDEHKVSILHISMSARNSAKHDKEKVDRCIRILVDYFEKDKNAKVFKNVEQELIVVYPNMSLMTVAYQNIQNTFYQDTISSDFPPSLFVLISDTSILHGFEELLQLLRNTKYENRQMIGNQVCYVTSYIVNELRAKTEMEQELIQAIEDDRIEVFFQPIYSVKMDKFESAEALVRIRTEDGQIIPPGKFIPIAEECGLISILGEIVFDKTCEFIAQNDIRNKLGLQYIEVNLSVLQCEQRDLAERYICIMRRYNIPADMINLEITETGSVQTKQNLLENMNRLIAYGLTFSLDDFGNGHSNLDYVIEMPVSIMKLDMSMVQAYFNDPKAKYVMQATIKMAHDMELFLVSEGVETKEQLHEMKMLGVDYVQGYYFSKPLPAEEFADFLHKKNHETIFDK